jgi:quinoprotein dehydrogenase-associated probable ABC transporter substrate-binding protein
MSFRFELPGPPPTATVHPRWTRRASVARSLSASAERAILLLPLLALVAFEADRARDERNGVIAGSVLPAHHARVLRVCADPNNLPFSNARGEGIENKLADLVAGEMHATVQYEWWAQRRGFFRNTLKAGKCDVVMSVPSSFEMALTTRPYYRSTYVFVTKRRSPVRVRTFDDPILRTARVGVQLIGDEYANAPPAHALTKRGIVQNVRGYTLYGDYREPNPPARIMDAVAKGDVDVAVVWGPLAGYFATREPVPLRIVPVSPQIDLPFLPMVFDIAVGTRRDDRALRDEIDAILVRRRAGVDSLLARFGVPRVDTPASPNAL